MKNKKRSVDFLEFLGDYCSEEWVLLVKSYIKTVNYKKASRIFNEGDPVKAVYFINTGKVKVVSHFDLDNERILRLSNPGDFLGHRAFKSLKFPISSIALEEAQVTIIPIDIFIKLVKANPELAIYLLEFFANDLRKTEERMINIIHNDVIVRLGVILCMLIDAYGYENEKSKRLSFMLSRSDLANFAGTVYESVIRNLAKLEEMGLVKNVGKNMIILKEKELRKFSHMK